MSRVLSHRFAVSLAAVATVVVLAMNAVAAPATLVSSPAPESPPDVMGPGSVLHVGRLVTKVTNWGIVGNPFMNLSSDPSAQWPGASGIEYLNSISFAVSAINPVAVQPQNIKRVSYAQEWGPGSSDFADRIHTTFEGASNGTPYVNDDGDRDVITDEPLIDEDFLDGRDDDGDGLVDEDFAALGQQMFSLVMRDDGPYAVPNSGEPHEPFGLECRQRAWAYSLPGYTNFVAIEYTIYNRSGHTLDSLTVGWRVDADLGPIAQADFHADDRDLPRHPSGEFIRVLEGGGLQRQYPHHPSLDVSIPADSALCPRVAVRINGFSFADDDGDGGETGGIATFLLLGHTIDPTGIKGPARVGFRSFRRFSAGTPFSAGGNPGSDAERFQLMSSTEGVDPASGFISATPAASAGDYVTWCSIGPFRDVLDGESVQATVAFAVQSGDYPTASDYEADYSAYQAGVLGAAELFSKHRPLANAYNIQALYEGLHVALFGIPVPDFHGRETAVIVPRGTPPIFLADCRDVAAGTPRLVTDLSYTWFDFDCDYCTGVWDYPSGRGQFQRYWIPSVTLVGVEPPAPGAVTIAGLQMLPPAPNPTREQTQVAFVLSRAGRARIEVRDVAGRAVRVLATARYAAGRHEIEWDGEDDLGRPVPSGIYFVTVTVGGASESAKLLLMR